MDTWYVKNTGGKVFGPIDLATLVSWTKDGRVEPLAGLSTDLKHWILAPQKPELEMDWVVENNPGQFYGPVNRAVIDTWRQSGALSAEARFYQDDRGAADALRAACDTAQATRDAACAELEKVRAELAHARTELARARAELENLGRERERLLHALNDVQTEQEAVRTERDQFKSERDEARAAHAETHAALEAARAAHTALTAECDRLKAEKEERERLPARTWETDVIVPEIIHDTPPPVMPSLFKPSGATGSSGAPSLADLERQAQAELARMGASGAKTFFTRRK